jgi:hypothetical protein
VSFEESCVLGEELNLTIVDGIIDQVLAKKEFIKSLETLFAALRTDRINGNLILSDSMQT